MSWLPPAAFCRKTDKGDRHNYFSSFVAEQWPLNVNYVTVTEIFETVMFLTVFFFYQTEHSYSAEVSLNVKDMAQSKPQVIKAIQLTSEVAYLRVYLLSMTFSGF